MITDYDLIDFDLNENYDVPAALHWEKVRWPVGWVEAAFGAYIWTCRL